MPSLRAARWGVGAAILLVTLSGGRAAFADPAADAATAEELFREGKRLMGAKEFASGCPMLAESQRLDPAPGTLLALAYCHDGEGRIASAWAEYTSVAGTAKDAERASVARTRADALRTRLPRLKLVIAPDTAALPGVAVRRDGVELGRATWPVPIPVDPGPHEVEVSAPGRQTFTAKVAAVEGEVFEQAVPALALVQAEPVATPTPVDPPKEQPPSSTRTVVAYTLGAVGLVGIGVGTVFGVRALAKADDADSACPKGVVCTNPEAATLTSDGRTYAWVANIGIGVGAAALIAGTYLLLTGNKRAPRSARVTPAVTPNGGSLTLGGAF